ncbi:DUF2304 domain-containing protein [Thalassotalea piscium]|uniref:DUF2304 domain-containing protein n=1 Tax=Thalassotalea piscium TaxID=1230533 RepID=A0A7X0TT46_9GAMM|nr:DUF2304 domain-containing protein [Thalassotalea piscium]MBB6542774.1 hypothetical protein [Thalassotalea piscium]
MTNPQIVSSIIGVVLAFTIYWLVRRDHIAPRQALRWIFVAFIVLVLGTFPVITDWIGHAAGISYPPIIPVILGLGAAIIKILLMDIERNKVDVTLDRIVQKLAILESQIEVNEASRTKEIKK